MNCDQAKEQLADFLAGTLGPAEAGELDAHFAQCPACRQESEGLRETWRMLGLLEQAEPSAAVRARFYDSLEGYRQGMASAAPAARRRPLFEWGWWTPGRALGWSAAVLLAGLALGYGIAQRQSSPGDLARLREEVYSMRQMVALSLLQQQSASERLRGVDYAGRVEQSDTEVRTALLHAVNHDPNVNVRLAAVDALRRFASSPAVRNTLDQTLARQDSPLVQIALIDLMVEMRDSQAVPALQDLERSPAVNKDVKQRAVWGLTQLQ
jgi:Putative zinc-finger